MSAIAALTALPASFAHGQSASATTPVTFFGELRARTEWDRPGESLSADVFTYLRTRIGIRAAPADGVGIVLQMQDSRVYGAASGGTNTFHLHQGYVDLSTTWRAASVTTRIGRQEVALGNERLVGVVNWSNTGRSFDAARIMFAPQGATAGSERWTATAFLATVDERGRRFGAPPAASADPVPADRSALGVFASRRTDKGTLDATLLIDAGASYRAYSGSDRVTLDGRFRTPGSARLGLELEGAYQTGQQRVAGTDGATSHVQDVGAWLLGARLGAFAKEGRRTSWFVGADVLSGDAIAQDGNYSAFATMYATNHSRYGLMDLFGDPAAQTKEQGLVDVLAMLDTELNSRTTLRAELHRYAAQAGDTREIGWELDITAPIRLSSAASIEFGYGVFRASPGAEPLGLGASGSSRHWAYAMMRAAF